MRFFVHTLREIALRLDPSSTKTVMMLPLMSATRLGDAAFDLTSPFFQAWIDFIVLKSLSVNVFISVHEAANGLADLPVESGDKMDAIT